MIVDFTKFDSLISVAAYFSNEERCISAIVQSRWSDGDIICPYCGEHHCKRRTDGKYRCSHCLRNFTCTVGTIFENTKLPLVKWFLAMYLISSHKKGISSHQLSRDIHVTQKTAWYMLQKVRSLFQQSEEVYYGEIECDEVYIGGREKWKHKSMRTPNTQGRSTKTKTPVFGMLERSEIVNSKGDVEFMSYVKAMVVEKTDKRVLNQ